VPGETARVAHVGGGQVDDHHVAARLERAERFAQPGERRVVQRAGGAHGRGEPAVLPGCPCPGHHDPPEVAWADPEVADGVDVADADEEDDDADEEDDDVLLAGVLAAELAVPAAAVPCCAAAGRATAMAAAAAALARPAPAVTAASLVLPLRRRWLALASSASGGSRSGVMKPSSQ
jgi:predicted protein tyrosine phosphatase